MESLADTLWDVVICGTGLQQSLLALALSRSDKKILHIDPHSFYGGGEAAFSLQEAESWVGEVAAGTEGSFTDASITKPDGSTGLSFPRAYSLALAPQMIHARSELLSQLVSSRAYRQVEFLAVGSFFIFKPSTDPSQKPELVRIPSTREAVFATTAITSKAKRGLMKFLKFVMDYNSETRSETWKPYADVPLTEFLFKEFKMDQELQTYIITLTLSLDGKISTRDGLAAISRHLSSMGVYGVGFAALYPKWGGLSEIAQVSCRAGAVGGTVYMLGTGIKEMNTIEDTIELQLTSGDTIKTKKLVKGDQGFPGVGISRLVAVINSPLKSLFEPTVEGAPIPAVAALAFPPGLLSDADGKVSENPTYLFAHSSDTGECPSGQSVLYLTTQYAPGSMVLLQKALDFFLEAAADDSTPKCLYQLRYDQRGSDETPASKDASVFHLQSPSPSLAFNDSALESVREAWKAVMGDTAVDAEYMTFTDREGAMGDDDDVYD
ncbi:putative rab proteins geranylgeranyltransferase component A [Podospora australis]|uniref:Rab proteins geranylgeranyltransferase n=1 Tax=Podospora australis TaxID=1536484 RepID=A0AAN6X282_9PEZI|nr:putative rab proteins geranylgeranyltransferase component A [Podospora australis]